MHCHFQRGGDWEERQPEKLINEELERSLPSSSIGDQQWTREVKWRGNKSASKRRIGKLGKMRWSAMPKKNASETKRESVHIFRPAMGNIHFMTSASP